MGNKYLAFDIEIAKELPETVSDWTAYRPLGITCAATLASDTDMLSLWYGRTRDDAPADRLAPREVQDLVEHLAQMADEGYSILTWNGLGFDFDILAEESNCLDWCQRLASDHIDMMFHVMCRQGYPVSLDNAAKGMGLPGKPPGMSGSLAPKMWAEGKHQQVLDYVAQDVRSTLRLAQITMKRRCLSWIARSGKKRHMPLRTGWLTVREAQTLPVPDTSWMTSPLPRTRFTDWLEVDKCRRI